MKKNFWSFFQGLGKTFMLPVALLAFMGILLGIGSSFTSPATIQILPFLDNALIQVIFNFMATLGSFAFSYLPIMFAMAIPLGLAKSDKGVAAFSGFVGYMMTHLMTNFFLTQRNALADLSIRGTGQTSVLGIQSLDSGVLGGIIVGIIVYLLHERFHTIKLPDSFSFFGGPRFVPIITSITCAFLGLLFPLFWPFFAKAIQGLGQLILGMGVFAPFVFGMGERLLLPFGLHHILVAMVRFTEVGGTQEIAGQSVSGALNIFYAQLKAGETISPSATQFLSQGKMPSFMFGLPGAAFAIYKTAKIARRPLVKGVLISGVVASVVAGITEPLEFLFLFVSPILYLIHAVLTGLGFMIMGLLKVTIGNTDGNIIDFIVFGVLQGTQTKWPLVIIVGLIWFALYYFIFKTLILKWNLPLIGREEDDLVDGETSGVAVSVTPDQQAANILAALGGTKNIDTLDNCITRLRLVVHDGSLVDEKVLKQNGAIAVVRLDNSNIQVVIGPQVASVRQQIEKIM